MLTVLYTVYSIPHKKGFVLNTTSELPLSRSRILFFWSLCPYERDTMYKDALKKIRKPYTEGPPLEG
jgi:hypothetical protein